jgi:plastocyanin
LFYFIEKQCEGSGKMKIKIKIGKIFCGLFFILVGLTFLGVCDSRADSLLEARIISPPATTYPGEPIGNTVTIDKGDSVSFLGTARDLDGDDRYYIDYLWDAYSYWNDSNNDTPNAPWAHRVIGSSPSFSYIFDTAGKYKVTLMVRDVDGNTSFAFPDGDLYPSGADVGFVYIEVLEVSNQKPTATITSPSGNRTITTGDSVSFSGIGNDPDGTLTGARWNLGSCSGTQLSSSSSFSRTFSTAGTYRIYFSVRDNDGAWSTNCPYRTITVNDPAPTNQRPTAIIDSPSNGTSIIVMNSINFSGRGTDTDGYITAYSWHIVAPGANIYDDEQDWSFTFGKTGSYQACLSVQDDDGAWSTNSACVNFSVNDAPPPPNQLPTATITSPSGNRTITTGDSVSFSGTGSDPDGSITNYRWNLGSCSGTQLSSSSSFSRTFSTAGTYRIYFSVRDNDGAWSTNCPYRTITVSAPTCTSSCGSWSACSASCDGGTQTRTCTRTDCSTYTQSQTCNTQPCCTPDCTCASSTCVGNTCPDGCGGTCSGTGTCNLSGYSDMDYSCSSNILTTTERWYSYYCVSGGCSSPVLVDTNSSTDDCNTGESCATGTPKSRCVDSSTVEDYKEYTQGVCNQSEGRCDYSTLECDLVTTPCEVGYICKETNPDQAECVPKSIDWAEI